MESVRKRFYIVPLRDSCVLLVSRLCIDLCMFEYSPLLDRCLTAFFVNKLSKHRHDYIINEDGHEEDWVSSALLDPFKGEDDLFIKGNEQPKDGESSAILTPLDQETHEDPMQEAYIQ